MLVRDEQRGASSTTQRWATPLPMQSGCESCAQLRGACRRFADASASPTRNRGFRNRMRRARRRASRRVNRARTRCVNAVVSATISGMQRIAFFDEAPVHYAHTKRWAHDRAHRCHMRLQIRLRIRTDPRAARRHAKHHAPDPTAGGKNPCSSPSPKPGAVRPFPRTDRGTRRGP
jgi:hypothetical protein